MLIQPLQRSPLTETVSGNAIEGARLVAEIANQDRVCSVNDVMKRAFMSEKVVLKAQWSSYIIAQCLRPFIKIRNNATNLHCPFSFNNIWGF